jgi:predicted outer membrane repeat protein
LQSGYGNLFLDKGGLVKNCIFRNNTAAYGGAIYLNALDGLLTVNGCFFDSNKGGVCLMHV